MTFGQYLKNLREKKAIRLEEIASITKIHLHSLQLMEQDRWTELPPEPFIRGFIIAYGKYVGAEVTEVLRTYQEEVKGIKAIVPSLEDAGTDKAVQTAHSHSNGSTKSQIPPSEISLPAEMIENMDKVPGRKLLLGGFVVILAVLVVGIMYIGKQSEQTRESASTAIATAPVVEIPKVEGPLAPTAAAEKPEARQVATTAPVVATTPPTTAPVATTATAPVKFEKKHNLRIEGKERCWMKVVVDEEKPKQSYLKPGQTLEFAADKKIKLVLGNAVENAVFYNGKAVPGKLYQGKIHYFIYPGGSKFPQDPPPAKKIDSVESPTETPAGAATPGPAEEKKDGPDPR